MQPTFTIHRTSLVAGLVLAGVAFVSMSQTPVMNARTVNVQYVPDPRDYIQIKEGAPYTVPDARLFVLTGLGTTDGGAICVLRVDGHPEATTSPYTSQFGGPGIESVPAGLTVRAGSTIDLAQIAGSGTPVCRAWGYLAPQ